jgi:hypothetical protein
MYLFLTDETNKPPELDRFFIYGGLVIESERLPALDRAIARIRREHNYPPGETFKFSNVGNNDATEHREAKAEALAAVADLGASFIATMILRQVIAGQVDGELRSEEYIEWSINTATAGFHKFLRSKPTREGHGAMFIDRDADPARFNRLAERYQLGLAPTGYRLPVNDRIHLFGMTNNNSSHLSSAADIALGAFRYCVNFACGDGREDVSRELMASLSRLIWSSPTGRRSEFGYIPRPVPANILHPGHRRTYARVTTTLAGLAA